MKEGKELDKKRDMLQRHAFEFMFQMVAIIGCPAFLAVYFGKKIGIANGSHPKTMIIFILLALVFSWTIIIIKFLSFNKEIKEVDKKIKENK